MGKFKGFSPRPDQLISLPAEFFSEILPLVNDLCTLKVILFAFNKIVSSEEQFPFLSHSSIMNDQNVLSLCGVSPEEQRSNLLKALANCCDLGVLLHAPIENSDERDILYFINSPRGQKAVEAVQAGTFSYNPVKKNAIQLTTLPNIYRLYEENIGPLTPIIADSLSEIENEYSPEWIEAAFQEAAKSNVRNLRYIEAILKNWQEVGKNVRTNRRRSQKSSEEHDPDRYISGEFSDFIDH